MKKNDRVFEKIATFLQNRQSKKRHNVMKQITPFHTHNTQNSKTTTLCARFAFGVPFKTLRKVGEKRLSALSLFFSLLVCVRKVHHRENTVRRAQIIIQNTVISSHHAERTFNAEE
jgi:hypothetical protein|tara:strand:- start:191 stop:538 length:348 start_codon:yes stop_codon:yes gene_type:complete